MGPPPSLPGDIEEDVTVPEEPSNQSEGGATSAVAIGAGIAGGIAGLIILVGICACGICLCKKVQIQVLFSDKNKEENTHDRNPMPSPSEIVMVQPNLAYRVTPASFGHGHGMEFRNELAGGQMTWMNQPTRGGGSRSCDHNFENRPRNERPGVRTHVNVAYRHGNTSHPTSPLDYELPLQQIHATFTSDTEDHTYDYLS